MPILVAKCVLDSINSGTEKLFLCAVGDEVHYLSLTTLRNHIPEFEECLTPIRMGTEVTLNGVAEAKLRSLGFTRQ